jgi:hypothetical protein
MRGNMMNKLFYKDVLVIFDEDRDDRILRLIEKLSIFDRNDIIWTQEHEGLLTICWSNIERLNYYDTIRNKESVCIEGDIWMVDHKKENV